MFLVNSRLGHFSAPTSLWDPFSRSYGVNLPSSLAVIHSSTLGYSPHPPVSVYGTGRIALNDSTLFSQAGLPALSARPKTRRTVGFQVAPTPFNVLFRQHAAVSLLGHVSSHDTGGGILTACASPDPFGFGLAPGSP